MGDHTTVQKEILNQEFASVSDLLNIPQFGTHGSKSEWVDWRGEGEKRWFQLYDDVVVRQHHFVPECVEEW